MYYQCILTILKLLKELKITFTERDNKTDKI